MMFLSTAGVVTAQQMQKNDRSVFYDYGESFYSEAHAAASASADSSKIFVYFKISYDAMSFTATPAAEQRMGSFKSAATINVECRDEIGIIRHRAEWTKEVYVQKFDETNSKMKYIFGALEMTVRPGKYTITLDATDQSRAVLKRVKMPPVNAQSFLKTTTNSDIQFAQPASQETSRIIRPFALGGSVPFSSGGFRAIASVSGLVDSDMYTYVVSQAKNTETDNVWGKVQEIVGQARPLNADVLKLSENTTLAGIELEMAPAVQSQSAPSGTPSDAPKSVTSIGLLDVNVPGESLVPGKYQFQFYKQGSSDTITQFFDVIWDNMPLSLRNSRYAAEAMYYILTDKEYEQLLRGSDNEVKAKIFSYWRKNDPTPQTTFNEDLAAYFHRVDYAFFNFQTIEERDGSKTERGKIYILHGKPTSINRSYDPDKPVIERWRYENNLKKEFVFEAITEGRFKLKEIVEISQK